MQSDLVRTREEALTYENPIFHGLYSMLLHALCSRGVQRVKVSASPPDLFCRQTDASVAGLEQTALPKGRRGSHLGGNELRRGG